MSAVAAWEVVPGERGAGGSAPRRDGRSHLHLVRADEADSVCRLSEPSRARALGPRRDRPSRSVRARRRAVLAVGVVVLLAVTIAGLSAARAGAAGPHLVTVRAGQTLSEIAAHELPDLPIGTAVAEIQIANRLNTSHVHAGQELLIPDAG